MSELQKRIQNFPKRKNGKIKMKKNISKFISDGVDLIKKNQAQQPKILNYYGLLRLIETYNNLGAKTILIAANKKWKMSLILKTVRIDAKGNNIEELIENFNSELRDPMAVQKSIKKFMKIKRKKY